METTGSVTRWIQGVREGDQDAVARLWDRYFHRLASAARARLDAIPSGAGDQDDVALSAFHSFCRRVEQGRLPNLQDREDLWRVLVVIAKRKAIDWVRQETAKKRGGGQPRGEAMLGELVSQEPTPDFTAELLDELRHLLDGLRREDGTLCLIALRRLEGYSNAEIGGELSLTPRTIERKLQRIAVHWAADAERRDAAGLA